MQINWVIWMEMDRVRFIVDKFPWTRKSILGFGSDRNFGIANQKQGGGMLPMGLECHDPTPLGDTKERLIFDGGEGKIVNGTEAGINWPFIVRLVNPCKDLYMVLLHNMDHIIW